jgi:hypothetical protein
LPALVGGVDALSGDIGLADVAAISAGNAVIAGAAGYVFAPAGWQSLPLPR